MMKLNVNKCELMYFPPNKRDNFQPVITLGAATLKIVDSYKYLGFLLNTKLDSNMQWDRVLENFSSVPHLLRQLRRIGLCTEILINVFKSLVLSHFRYSGILLDSCTERTKDEMQHFQNKLLRIIGVQRDEACTKYGVGDIRVFIERTGMEQTLRVLNSSTHSLPTSLLASRKSHSTFPFTIPRAKTTKFNESLVLKALRHLRENVHGTGRKVTRLQASTQGQAIISGSKARNTVKCSHCGIDFKRKATNKCKTHVTARAVEKASV
jgi:hypothetical protein